MAKVRKYRLPLCQKSASLVDRIVENLERMTRKAEKEEQRRNRKKAQNGEAEMEEPVRVVHGVMDANPRTKRIKDLQEQIHAREFGLGDEEGAKNNGWEEKRQRRERPKLGLR